MQTVNTAIERLVEQHLGETFPACTLAVVRGGETVLEAAWGDVEGAAATTATLFDLASVTKLFTVTTFLSIISAGGRPLETLHEPLVQFVPAFGKVNPREIDGEQNPHTRVRSPAPPERVGETVNVEGVTLWHLLTHTSGLPAWRDVFNAAGTAPPPPDEADSMGREARWQAGLRALCHYDFVGQPGERVIYSDVGLMLLGEVTAQLGGKPLEQLIGERTLAAGGMQHTLFNPVREGGLPREASAPTEFDELWRRRRAWGEVHDENACGVGGVSGHAGLFGTAGDVARLGVGWLNDPTAIFGIDERLATMAVTEQAASESARRGLGFALKTAHESPAGDVMSGRTFGHTGFTGTSLWVDPTRELVVACLTNRVYRGRHYEGILPFRRALHDLIAQAAD